MADKSKKGKKKDKGEKSSTTRKVQMPPRVTIALDAGDIAEDVGKINVGKRGAKRKAAPVEVALEGIEEPEPHFNHDVCDSCQGGGDLLCCDACPNAFHFDCVEPVLTEFPTGDWFCRECSAKKDPPKKLKSGIFAPLLNSIAVENPRAFKLPRWLSGTDWEAGGKALEYAEIFGVRKVAAIVRDEDDLDFGQDKQPLNADFCFVCGRKDHLLPCDLCARAYHLTCLDTPLKSFPTSEWICPAHTRFNTAQARKRAHDRRRQRMGIVAKHSPIQFSSDIFRLDWPLAGSADAPVQQEKARSKQPLRGRTAATVSVAGVVPYHTKPKPAPTAQEQSEFLIGLEAFTTKLQGEVEAKAATMIAMEGMKERTTEAQVVQLLQMQQKLLEEAMPSTGASVTPAPPLAGVAPSETSTALLSPETIGRYLSPTFTQFLAWQRLLQITREVDRAQQTLRTASPMELTAECRDGVLIDTVGLQPPKKKRKMTGRPAKPFARLRGDVAYDMFKTSIVIGRSTSNTVGGIDVDLRETANSRGVSHKHCTITYDPATRQFHLLNLGKNGTKVNGTRYQADQGMVIEKEVEIEMGRVMLRFTPVISAETT